MLMNVKNIQDMKCKALYLISIIVNFVVMFYCLTELTEALQKKAISLLTGGAVDRLQTGNRRPMKIRLHNVTKR